MSNVKFKHKVNTYAEAAQVYGQPKFNGSLGYNTRLRKVRDDYQVVHHETAILTYHADGSVTFDAMWVSRTTANRLYHFKPEFVDRVNSHVAQDGAWYTLTMTDGETLRLEQGERVQLGPLVHSK